MILDCSLTLLLIITFLNLHENNKFNPIRSMQWVCVCVHTHAKLLDCKY